VAQGNDVEPLGVAVIGAGLMGAQHARTIAACDATELVAVTGADAAQAQALAAEHGSRHIEDIERTLADPRVDAVVVATPTDTHVAIGLQAVAAGVHAFVEKPVARTIEDAVRLRDAAAAAGIVVGVGHVARYFPEYRAMGAAIARGDVGTPAVATLGRQCQQPDWAPDHWHTSMARSGGVAVDMLVHDIDLIRSWFGEPDTVYARVIGSDKYDGLDVALATLTIPDGPICHIHGSWAEPEGFSQSAEICGSAGMISYDSRGRDELSIAAHSTSSGVTALPPQPPGPRDPFQLQLRDFVRHVRTGEAMPGDIDWAVGSLRIALAMLESSDRRGVVVLAHNEVAA
jgi:predicted dehydrogenase